MSEIRNPKPREGYRKVHRTPKWVSFEVFPATWNKGAQYISYPVDRYDPEVLERIPKVKWTFDE
jgi:hypothetical protein